MTLLIASGLAMAQENTGRVEAMESQDVGQKELTKSKLHTELAAKGDENGIDCAHHYHYFARGGLPYLAS